MNTGTEIDSIIRWPYQNTKNLEFAKTSNKLHHLGMRSISILCRPTVSYSKKISLFNCHIHLGRLP